MKNFDLKYNDLPKTEIHIHLEGSIRTGTILDVAKEYDLKLPAYEVDELDKHVKIYDQMRDLHAVLEAFAIFQNSITSPQVVERIAWELFEDAAKQNVKLFEVRFSPDWAFHGHDLDWDKCLESLIRAKSRAEAEFDMAIGFIAITSRSMGPASCVKTVDWAIRHKEYILGIDLADSEKDFPLREFVPSVMKAKEAGLKVTIHTGEDSPASFVKETIELASPDPQFVDLDRRLAAREPLDQPVKPQFRSVAAAEARSVFRGQGVASSGQAFTAPAFRSGRSRRCRKANSTSTGTVTDTEAAIRMPHSAFSSFA